MLSFINNQTYWYKEKKTKIDKANILLLKETKAGCYILALRAIKEYGQILVPKCWNQQYF